MLDAGVASLLWLSTVAQNFLNFLCRYFESFVVLVKDDEMSVEVADAAGWSDFGRSAFVRLMVTGVFLELFTSSFFPPGSSVVTKEVMARLSFVC